MELFAHMIQLSSRTVCYTQIVNISDGGPTVYLYVHYDNVGIPSSWKNIFLADGSNEPG